MLRKTAILVPADGFKVPDPRTGDMLPEVGRRVEMSTYWTRRLSEGCVKIKEELKTETVLKSK